MNMPEIKCFLSLVDGQVLKLPPGDPTLTQVRTSSDYVAIEAVPSRIQYQWLDDFIATVEEESLRTRLVASINGKGAFRRFKDILLTLPDERRRWFEFRDLAMRQRVVDWVYELGITPINQPEWLEEGGAAEVTGDEQAQAVTEDNAQTNSLDGARDLRGFLLNWVDENGMTLPPQTLENISAAILANFDVSARDADGDK